MGNRGSTTQPVAKVPSAPSSKERKAPPKKTPQPSPVPVRKSSLPRGVTKATPEKEKTQKRGEKSQSNEKKKEEAVDRTAKEIKKESQKKRSSKKKTSGKYVDGVLVSAEGTKKKPTSRTPNKTSSVERRKGAEGKKNVSDVEKSKKKHTKREESVERSTEQTADEKTCDSSARRNKMKAKSAEDVTKTTEQTEKTKEETVPTFENDDTLVSDAPKRKKYADDKEENVKAFLKGILGKGVKGLKEEFESLKREVIPLRKNEMVDEYSEFLKANNSSKNRYKDVPRLNDSKVTLKERNEEESYIHANYCTTPKGDKRFICTQGPNEKTHNDFWWMVCQEEVEFIVMLCNFFELGKPKCDKYFPMEEGEILSTDDFKIQCMSVHGHKWPETVTIRKLIVTKKEGEKDYEVQHLHWESWPDRGVPPINLSLFKLLARVGKSTKPIVVHCSAGIGRTGTTVVVQIAMEMLSGGLSLAEGLAPVLKKLRTQRAMSVQNETQYIFIHRILLEYFKDAIDDEETTQFCSDYHKLTK